MDFAALPPEINSGRMYAGAGAAPLLDAAAAWDNLAAELTESAASIGSTVTALAAAWIGPSASAMTRAASSYQHWLMSTALSAEQTASQASAAAEAYGTAFAATVPPPLIAANRARLAALSATNLLGINTAAIMATEAAYAEYWAQDAAAMYAYQAESAAATSALPQFTAAPQVANPAQSTNPILQFIQTLIPGFEPGQPLQNLALLLTSPLSNSFISSAPTTDITSILALFTGLFGISAAATYGMPGAPGAPGGAAIVPDIAIPETTPETTPEEQPTIRAGIADGERLGRLSVPPNWAQESTRGAPPDQTNRIPAATPDMAGLGGLGGLGGLAGIPRGGTPTKQQRPEPEYGTRSTVMPRHPYGG